ncbi:hypothetical protein PI124_g3250 [Phytophthora idaei]|nr:hypothetical protein PI125_g2942 [Phytophthora idaei]KAG3149958.1 hypothetical protein PI126_g11761 [Phytophthora idaei]KAG3252134.1 hypothetical protein PI124_g3250 [Phytophthora idaei]
MGGQGCGSEEFVPVSSESEDEPDLQSIAAKPLLPPSSYAGIDGIALDDIADTIATTYVGGVCEDSSIWMTQAIETPDPEPGCSDEIPSSVSATDTQDPHDGEKSTPPPEGDFPREGIASSSPVPAPAFPSDQDVLNARDFILSVPTRLARAQIRHQVKKRPGSWHVPRSRKRRY